MNWLFVGVCVRGPVHPRGVGWGQDQRSVLATPTGERNENCGAADNLSEVHHCVGHEGVRKNSFSAGVYTR